MLFARLSRLLLTSSGMTQPQTCMMCSGPICASCGLHSKAVTVGGGFCSTECAETPPEKRRITQMRGGVTEEISFV
jgi:hypothetical protein